MSNINKQELRLTAEKAKDNFMPNFMVPTRDVLALLDELEAMHKYAKYRDAENEGLMLTVGRLRVEKEAAEKRIAELEALARGVKQYSEFQICHYGATEDYAKGYIDCQNNYNKVLFAAACKGDAS
ncbi:ead/Ea22-like family protein [Citrobacter freundii]|nr:MULTISPECIES: ead/Ea22-like family protein [Enterobacteriaceae]MDL4477229.1 ead/Ea22-like family protein [Enterobacter hormaechei]MDL4480590.1 ead/Ea22-like family protein [Enterobacter hormaechei]MDL4495416.1 ead/Ea22-like family protein [Enterobacter hormaechei]MDL4542115.1 ead/Ea22-like family protein [Enterobacter hormaechei]MDL4718929.1 ead/Ea22-like family protein [Enterobacter hormaechei]